MSAAPSGLPDSMLSEVSFTWFTASWWQGGCHSTKHHSHILGGKRPLPLELSSEKQKSNARLKLPADSLGSQGPDLVMPSPFAARVAGEVGRVCGGKVSFLYQKQCTCLLMATGSCSPSCSGRIFLLFLCFWEQDADSAVHQHRAMLLFCFQFCLFSFRRCWWRREAISGPVS